MRGTATRTALVTAIEGISTLDSDAGGEAFTYVDAGRSDVSLPERAFTLERLRLDLTEVMTSRVLTQIYLCRVFYGQYEGVGDRMHEDAERLPTALWSLHTTEADICSVDLGGMVEYAAAEFDGNHELQFEIAVKYQLDTGV